MSEAETLAIDSRDAGASLVLRPHSRHHFIAQLNHAGLVAAADVYSYMSGGLGDFFDFMAANWMGWADVKEWGSLEGELVLRARSDRTGHVYIHVRLRCGAPAKWTAEMELVLEAGQLERLAIRARQFEESSIRAT